jgi:TorA maturation chaperone TorD
MKPTSFTQYSDALRDRMNIYALLSRLFRVEIDEDLLSTLMDGGVLEADDTVPPELHEGIALMQAYLDSPDASTLDLARDYAKVFCGASSTNKTAAYPFESVYTSDEGILMQEARDDALRWYRRFGLGKSADWNDCEDHIGLELEFMAFLINESLDARESGDQDRAVELLQAQREFLQTHLLNWVSAFARDVARYSVTDFYRGLASFATAYLIQDGAALAGVGAETANVQTPA